jgi:ketosteroid isomerase-like protein
MAAKSIEKQLFQLEERYWQAIKDKDADIAMRLTDEDCLVTGAQGAALIRRPQFAGMMKSAKYTLHDYKLKDPQVKLISNDVAILAYSVHEELTVDGKPVTVDAADASTWIRRPEGWVCALHTESILGDPFGRDRHVE